MKTGAASGGYKIQKKLLENPLADKGFFQLVRG